MWGCRCGSPSAGGGRRRAAGAFGAWRSRSMKPRRAPRCRHSRMGRQWRTRRAATMISRPFDLAALDDERLLHCLGPSARVADQLPDTAFTRAVPGGLTPAEQHELAAVRRWLCGGYPQPPVWPQLHQAVRHALAVCRAAGLTAASREYAYRFAAPDVRTRRLALTLAAVAMANGERFADPRVV